MVKSYCFGEVLECHANVIMSVLGLKNSYLHVPIPSFKLVICETSFEKYKCRTVQCLYCLCCAEIKVGDLFIITILLESE